MGGNDIGGSVELLRENEGFEQSLHNAHISLRNVPSSQLQVLYLLLLMYLLYCTSYWGEPSVGASLLVVGTILGEGDAKFTI